MNAIELIVAERNTGEVIAGVSESAYLSAEELAASFGLSSKTGTYHGVSAEEARSVLATVIHRDMAYGHELVTPARAGWLAREFIGAFSPDATCFYTNGNFGRLGGHAERQSTREQPLSGTSEWVRKVVTSVGPSWSPATEATFDTGVLALGASLSACVWFKDED